MGIQLLEKIGFKKNMFSIILCMRNKCMCILLHSVIGMRIFRI